MADKKANKKLVGILVGVLVPVIVLATVFGAVIGYYTNAYDKELAAVTALDEGNVTPEQVDALLDFAILMTGSEGVSVIASAEGISSSFDTYEIIAGIGGDTITNTICAYNNPKGKKKNVFAAFGYKGCVDKVAKLLENLEKLDFLGSTPTNLPLTQEQILANTKLFVKICENIVDEGEQKYSKIVATVEEMLVANDFLNEISIKEIREVFEYFIKVTEGIDANDLYILDIIVNPTFRKSVTPGINQVLDVLRAIDREKFWELASNMPDVVSCVLEIANFAFVEQGAETSTVARCMYSVMNVYCIRTERPIPEFDRYDIATLLNRLVELSLQEESNEQRQEAMNTINEISDMIHSVFINKK